MLERARRQLVAAQGRGDKAAMAARADERSFAGFAVTCAAPPSSASAPAALPSAAVALPLTPEAAIVARAAEAALAAAAKAEAGTGAGTGAGSSRGAGLAPVSAAERAEAREVAAAVLALWHGRRGRFGFGGAQDESHAALAPWRALCFEHAVCRMPSTRFRFFPAPQVQAPGNGPARRLCGVRALAADAASLATFCAALPFRHGTRPGAPGSSSSAESSSAERSSGRSGSPHSPGGRGSPRDDDDASSEQASRSLCPHTKLRSSGSSNGSSSSPALVLVPELEGRVMVVRQRRSAAAPAAAGAAAEEGEEELVLQVRARTVRPPWRVCGSG
jgi:hypothetical protein